MSFSVSLCIASVDVESSIHPGLYQNDIIFLSVLEHAIAFNLLIYDSEAH